MCSREFTYRQVKDYYSDMANVADEFNIATGFVSNASIVELISLVKFRNEHGNDIKLNMLIGMNYLYGFTKVQYDAIKELSSFLHNNSIGAIYVSKTKYYHGKMYSFNKNGECLAAFIGSSNLGSFVGASSSYVEADVLFWKHDASALDHRIKDVIRCLGTNLIEIPPITNFKKPKFTLLNGNYNVERVPGEYARLLSHGLGYSIELPLKTKLKSNLNAYFGAGKTPDRYSPRDWYEVEIIINKDTPGIDKLPAKNEEFVVITDDDYKFRCTRQGDNGKNLRTIGDLRILGKWIKGHMEAEGALKLGQPVTEDTLKRFGKNKLVLTPTKDNIWLLKME